ncbi:hypothetical protein CPAV1605_1344 [seawater metagenome]|uniref:FAD dependent oxidoreductase n=1 Tax=seawater metagenome TaxID=1561972 RepID=A0A5E8CMA4_9ZZZZ
MTEKNIIFVGMGIPNLITIYHLIKHSVIDPKNIVIYGEILQYKEIKQNNQSYHYYDTAAAVSLGTIDKSLNQDTFEYNFKNHTKINELLSRSYEKFKHMIQNNNDLQNLISKPDNFKANFGKGYECLLYHPETLINDLVKYITDAKVSIIDGKLKARDLKELNNNDNKVIVCCGEGILKLKETETLKPLLENTELLAYDGFVAVEKNNNKDNINSWAITFKNNKHITKTGIITTQYCGMKNDKRIMSEKKIIEIINNLKEYGNVRYAKRIFDSKSKMPIIKYNNNTMVITGLSSIGVSLSTYITEEVLNFLNYENENKNEIIDCLEKNYNNTN